MKMTKIDWMVLVIPIVILIILIPFLPEQIPMQWNSSGDVNWTLSKYFFPITGVLPFIIYRSIKSKSKK